MNSTIFEELHCSETMELSLRRLIRYTELTGRSPEKTVQDWERRFSLPCRDRRAGKEILRLLEEETSRLPLPLAPAEMFPRPFTRIYAERQALKHPRAAGIFSRFKHLPVEEITHYKDVFNRTVNADETGRGLILAEQKGTLLYPGAPVCQNFGNAHFYYASCIRNCVFDCEYCYLKGMYPAEDVVVFLNLEDYFTETEALLMKHPVYLCVSFDTDLLGMEGWTGFAGAWSAFAAGKEGLLVEIRTKCGNRAALSELTPSEQLILAVTLSPEPVALRYEHGAPGLGSRLLLAKEALEKGFPVRLCFDPILFVEDWEKVYASFLDQVFTTLPPERIRDVGVGTFRISREYLKTLRKRLPDSPVSQYPYTNLNGVSGYASELDQRMERHFLAKLTNFIEENRIFWWKSQELYDKVDT